MTINIVFFVTLLAYSMLVSQSFMYLISLKSVQLSLDARSYTQLRHLIDAAMRANFKYVVYSALGSNLLLVVLSAAARDSVLLITSGIALLGLILDIGIMMKGNMPINQQINAWNEEEIPANWETFRNEWLRFFRYRQMASIAGFLALLAAAVFY